MAAPKVKRRYQTAQRQHKTCSFRTKGGRAYALGYAIKAMPPVTLTGCALTFLHASDTLKPARQRWLGPSGSIQERKIKQKERATACKDAGDPG
ncbi:hypothetical protein AU512_12270 [Lonsdalea iberica]|uniref:Uncharacterized protein n=1 Tax=Lonsdalea iberica TaxID=1082703 RepID=A0ABX3XE49_9GAMM|nr:hypothetical protein AU512_12270 [Lonsdalea iberica]